MTTETNVSTPQAQAQQTERIRAYSRVVKKQMTAQLETFKELLEARASAPAGR